ncbi:hypothetical protein ACFQZS_17785 [Mucilaginibacter calamicampi]|uniref:TonB C-terminal domain-containing protein n=1 Tax=Mucilaginibacter calamicampi TaxID=1302352 RepID=A0ABW2Z1P5_9SPHI
MPVVVFGQSTSLYNADGTLKADKQFKITKEVLLKAPVIEKELLASVYNNLKYPVMARENNYTGWVIVKFTSVGERVSFEIVKYKDEVFRDAVNQFFKSRPEGYLRSKIGGHGDIVFYLPIKFQMINNRFKKTLSTNKMLTIEAIEPAPDPVVTDGPVYIGN